MAPLISGKIEINAASPGFTLIASYVGQRAKAINPVIRHDRAPLSVPGVGSPAMNARAESGR